MTSPLAGLTLINLFVEDLPTARTFYADVLGLTPDFQSENSSAFSLGTTLINLLTIDAAKKQIAPATVAPAETGVRVQMAVQVDDIDTRCAELEAKGVPIINGPVDQPWGMRTACFTDPAGHLWEYAQPIG
jgi:catechol 2,3-dioxygenase-like lactoylglutathione lyase family enzyme